WLGRRDAPLAFSPRLSPRQWLWCARYLMQCRSTRYTENLRAMVRMAQYSRGCLQDLRTRLNLRYDHLERGILAFYRDPREFEHARRSAALMQELGVS